jgi:hypothetical protein
MDCRDVPARTLSPCTEDFAARSNAQDPGFRSRRLCPQFSFRSSALFNVNVSRSPARSMTTPSLGSVLDEFVRFSDNMPTRYTKNAL